MKPRPGDYAVVDTRKRSLGLSQLGKALSRGGFTMFDHAVICSRVERDGTVYIVEAMRGGAKERVWHYDDHDHLWSTGVVKTAREAGQAALRYVGRPFSWRDYAAIATHAMGWWVPGLRRYLANPAHLTGCQLVERAQLDAGVHLFTDHRWRGYVRPSDLAELILSVGELTAPGRRRTASAANGTPPANAGSRSRTAASATNGARSAKSGSRSRTTASAANGARSAKSGSRSRTAASAANGARPASTGSRSRSAASAASASPKADASPRIVTPGSGWPSRAATAVTGGRTADTGTRSPTAAANENLKTATGTRSRVATATATKGKPRQRRRWFS
ncbi:MAG: hypothetical protein J2P27_01395 [Actinobacteria bacterium]|nr:hypothetical protein [Actinomycetota bacterium]